MDEYRSLSQSERRARDRELKRRQRMRQHARVSAKISASLTAARQHNLPMAGEYGDVSGSREEETVDATPATAAEAVAKMFALVGRGTKGTALHGPKRTDVVRAVTMADVPFRSWRKRPCLICGESAKGCPACWKPLGAHAEFSRHGTVRFDRSGKRISGREWEEDREGATVTASGGGVGGKEEDLGWLEAFSSEARREEEERIRAIAKKAEAARIAGGLGMTVIAQLQASRRRASVREELRADGYEAARLERERLEKEEERRNREMDAGVLEISELGSIVGTFALPQVPKVRQWMDRDDIEAERARQKPVYVSFHDFTIGNTVRFRVLPGEGRAYIRFLYRYVGMRKWDHPVTFIVPTEQGLFPFTSLPEAPPRSELFSTIHRIADVMPILRLQESEIQEWDAVDDWRGRAVHTWRKRNTLFFLILPTTSPRSVQSLVQSFYIHNGTPRAGRVWPTHLRHDVKSLPPHFPADDDIQECLANISPAFANLGTN